MVEKKKGYNFALAKRQRPGAKLKSSRRSVKEKLKFPKHLVNSKISRNFANAFGFKTRSDNKENIERFTIETK